MLYFSHPASLEHDPRAHMPGHPDTPERLVAIERALAEPRLAGLASAGRRPRPSEARAGARPQPPPRRVDPRALPRRRRRDRRRHLRRRGLLPAALHAAGGGLRDDAGAARRRGPGRASARCAPPGTTPSRERAMGFCLFDNVAIAAELAIRELGAERVLVLDWDVHHGNGTAEAFRHRADVLFVSIHQEGIYPGTGAARRLRLRRRARATRSTCRSRPAPTRSSGSRCSSTSSSRSRVVRARPGPGLGRLRRPPRGPARRAAAWRPPPSPGWPATCASWRRGSGRRSAPCSRAATTRRRWPSRSLATLAALGGEGEAVSAAPEADAHLARRRRGRPLLDALSDGDTEVRPDPAAPPRAVRAAARRRLRAIEEAAGARAARFAGRAIWHVSSTLRGGGVAEMLRALLPYVRGAGIDTRWVVLRERAEFFELTKRIHNNLHGDRGDGGELGAEERELYERTSPPAPRLTPLLRRGTSSSSTTPRRPGWRRRRKRGGGDRRLALPHRRRRPDESPRAPGSSCGPTSRAADAYVFSRREYVWGGLDRERAWVMAPSIDPFSPKNQELDPATVDGDRRRDRARPRRAARRAGFTRADGRPGRVERRRGGPGRAALGAEEDTRNRGMDVILLDTILDDPDSFHDLMHSALKEDFDVILTTGGVSVGKFDFVAEGIKRLGAEVFFHRVAIRPGKPLFFARFRNGPVFFGFPGNPVAGVVAQRFFLYPYLRELMRQTPETTLTG